MVLDRVDQRLRVLDAHTHGERLGFEPDAPTVKHFVNIACRVARGQDDGRAFEHLVAARHPRDAPVAHAQVGDSLSEQETAARREDCAADIRNDRRQLVRADVRMRLAEDLGVGAVEDERFERLAVVAAFLAAREELAVGEGAGAALAERIVRIGIDRSVAVDLGDVALAVGHGTAALQQHGAQPAFDEPQRGEEPRGPRPHHEHLRAPRNIGIVEMHGRGLRLAVGINLQREAHLGPAPACVDRAAHHAHQRHLVVAKPQTMRREGRIALRIGRLARRKN